MKKMNVVGIGKHLAGEYSYRGFREEAMLDQNLQHVLAKFPKIIHTGGIDRHNAHGGGMTVCHVKERRCTCFFVYTKNMLSSPHKHHFNTITRTHLTLVL